MRFKILQHFTAIAITSMIIGSCKAPDGVLSQPDAPENSGDSNPVVPPALPSLKICETPGVPEAVFTPKPFIAHRDPISCLPDRQECWASHIMTNGYSYETSNHYYNCSPSVQPAAIWIAFYNDGTVYWGGNGALVLPTGGLATDSCIFTFRKGTSNYATAQDAILDTAGYLTAILLPKYNVTTQDWSGPVEWYNCSIVQYP